MNVVDEVIFKYLARKFAALVLFYIGEHLGDSALGDSHGFIADLLRLFLFDEADRRLGEVAHHALDVPADIADLGILGSFDL